MTSDPTSAAPRPSSRTSGRRRYGAGALVVAALAGLVTGAGLALLGGWVLLIGLNPVGDEWHCSDGEAPALHRNGGSSCFAEGARLPRGFRWDPLGNRPMSYNCDKRGWVEIERVRDGEFDCMAEGTALPEGWRVVE